jgi:hypothetical protein
MYLVGNAFINGWITQNGFSGPDELPPIGYHRAFIHSGQFSQEEIMIDG